MPDGNAMVSRWSDAEARRAMGGGSGTYTLEDYTLTLRDRDGRVWPLDLEVARASTALGFAGDPADKLIAATSVVHRVPLPTRDRRIRRSKMAPLAG